MGDIRIPVVQVVLAGEDCIVLALSIYYFHISSVPKVTMSSFARSKVLVLRLRL